MYTKAEVEMLVAIAKNISFFFCPMRSTASIATTGKSRSRYSRICRRFPDLGVVLDSMSKRYSLCGARLGMMVSLNREIMAGVLCIAQGRLSAGFVDQAIASKLTDVPASYLDGVQKNTPSAAMCSMKVSARFPA